MADTDGQKFDKFYRGNRDRLVRFLVSRLGDISDAEEVAQDAFAQYLRVKEKRAILLPYALLKKIAHNLATDRVRQNISRRNREAKWTETRLLEASADDTLQATPAVQEQYIETTEDIKRVVAALEELSKPVRTAFIFNKYYGMTHKEVAEQMGLSTSTIEKHIMKSMRHLMKTMGKELR
jgi:RNA polymerase sigma factor (sigma-70 family)